MTYSETGQCHTIIGATKILSSLLSTVSSFFYVYISSLVFSKEGGLRGLYRGFLPTLCGMIPYAGFSFYCFEMLKLWCMKYIPEVTCTPSSRNTGKTVMLLLVSSVTNLPTPEKLYFRISCTFFY